MKMKNNRIQITHAHVRTHTDTHGKSGTRQTPVPAMTYPSLLWRRHLSVKPYLKVPVNQTVVYGVMKYQH